MAKIFDLNCILTVHPISRVLDSFTRLCDLYAPPGHCTPSIFQHPVNNLWVAIQFYKHEATLIRDYKLGHHSTHEFLSKLHKVFSFISEQALMFTAKTLEKIRNHTEDYVCLRGKSNSTLTYQDYAFALLEQAWNSLIDIEELDLYRFDKIYSITQKEPVYLVCNSNELHFDKIYRTLRKEFNFDLIYHWYDHPKLQDGMLELAPNLYLVSSHLQNAPKTARDLPPTASNRTDFLEPLIKSLTLKGEPIQIIAKRYSNLHLSAKELGIKDEQIYADDEVLPKQLPRKKWR